MDRTDWVWVAVKALGIYFLARAVMCISSFLSSAFNIWVFWDYRKPIAALGSEGGALDSVIGVTRNALFRSALTGLVDSVFWLLVLGALGIYLLRRGAILLKWAHLSVPRVSEATAEPTQ